MRIYLINIFKEDTIQTWIINKIFSQYEIVQNEICDVIILAGSEYNKELMDKYQNIFKWKIPKIAIGVGTLNPEGLEIFNTIYSRNFCLDYIGLARVYQSADISFALDKATIFSNKYNVKNNLLKTIGIYVKEIDDQLLNFLSECKDYNIILYKAKLGIKYLGNVIQYNEIENQKFLYEISRSDYMICSGYSIFVYCTIMNIPFLGICDDKTRIYMKENNLEKYIIDDTSEIKEKFTELSNDDEIKNNLNQIYTKNSNYYENLFQDINAQLKIRLLIDKVENKYLLLKHLGFKINKKGNKYTIYNEVSKKESNLEVCCNILLNNAICENWKYLNKLYIVNWEKGIKYFQDIIDTDGIKCVCLNNKFTINNEDWIGFVESKENLQNCFDNTEIFQNCIGIYVNNKEIYNLLSNYLYMNNITLILEIIKFDLDGIIGSKIYKMI